MKESLAEKIEWCRKMQDIIAKLKNDGVLKPQKYDIAPLDTIGKKRYKKS